MFLEAQSYRPSLWRSLGDLQRLLQQARLRVNPEAGISQRVDHVSQVKAIEPELHRLPEDVRIRRNALHCVSIP
jgi:hypothetical protein